MSRVVVPQTVVVHDGVPQIPLHPIIMFLIEIILKMWLPAKFMPPGRSLRSPGDVLAIMSFTLNRVYTEWYRNQGYDFTITSSTAFDHKWIYGRNIYESISVIVDEIFDNYLSRPEVKQPIPLTQYCDGRKVHLSELDDPMGFLLSGRTRLQPY